MLSNAHGLTSAFDFDLCTRPASALSRLDTYRDTGKVFLAGNWEGDWVLLGASGCKPNGQFNLTCDPTPTVIDRMVQWVRRV